MADASSESKGWPNRHADSVMHQTEFCRQYCASGWVNGAACLFGFVDCALTRATFQPANGEYFEGKISTYSTSCFSDGICSVTVGGKVVVTTRGWARDPVGTLQGVDSIGDIEKVIGHNAKVYAAKTADGYTLYGNTNFYLKVE